MANANDFLGLTKKRAQDKAEALSLVFRLMRIDEEQFLPYPEDNFPDRICVEIDKSVVTKATLQ